MHPQISVLIPALNEKDNIGRAVQDVLSAFKHYKIKGELIIVDDGSTDGTGLIIDEICKANKNVRLIRHERAMGLGESYWEGFQSAAGELVTWLPGDGEGNAFDLLGYLPLMDQVDIVIPFSYNPEIRTFSRQLVSRVYRAIVNASFGTSINYTNGFVIYRKCITEGIAVKSKGFFYQTELLLKCVKKGYIYAEVPLGLKPRNTGKSKALDLKSLYLVMKSYLMTLNEIYFKDDRERTLHPDSVTFARKRHFEESLA